MLPPRQHLRDGRTRTALLAGGSLAGLLVLVLVAHPQLLPWNAGRGASGEAAAAGALPGPGLWAGGEELLVDTDLLQQQRLIESIYQARPSQHPAVRLCVYTVSAAQASAQRRRADSPPCSVCLLLANRKGAKVLLCPVPGCCVCWR